MSRLSSGVRFEVAPRAGMAIVVRVIGSGMPVWISESIVLHCGGMKSSPLVSPDPMFGIPLASCP
jgi:hypothetical protein